MRLKRLELLGFKSFADRTTFEYEGETLSGIVGPNGCGKSNVVDAMRWVLGEQRPTSMRGKEMTDVIFKGSTSRAAMGLAEVTMVLDNAGGTLPERGAEVAITRRVFQSGDGEYQIDGERVRLKDVREMLFDTGLGSRGYAVLEQGRIDAVLSANPLERRRIFEEAAGVSRYRQRKHETELRLKKVEQDLARIEDLLRELRSRKRSLEIQASKAQRWREARTAWEQDRLRELRHRLAALGRHLGTGGGELAELEARLAELRARRDALRAEVGGHETARAALAAEVDAAAAALTAVAGDLRALEERRAQLAARGAELARSAQGERTRAEGLAEALAARERGLSELEAERAALAGGIESARAGAAEQGQALRELSRRYKELRAASQAQNELVLGHLHQKTSAANSVRHLEGSRAPAEERWARLVERRDAAQGELEGLRAGAADLEGRLDAAREALTEADQARRELDGRAEVLEARVAECERARAEAELERARAQSRIDSLLDPELEREDLEVGARAVLEALEAGEGPLPASVLVGLLADHLRTSTEYARALDAVLGERARSLALRLPREALALVEWLRERDQGQAPLAVLAGLGEKQPLTPPQIEGCWLGGRVLGTLLELVQPGEGAGAVAQALCGDVLVVRDLETALALVARDPRWRCVTPEGELADAGGVIGGRRTLVQGAVGRRSAAEELRGEVARLLERERVEAERLSELLIQRGELREARREAGAALDARRAEALALQGELGTVRARLADHGGALAALERELSRAAEERARIERELEAARLALVAAEADFERENARLVELESDRRGLEEAREIASREEGRTQVALSRLEEQVGGLDRRLADQRRNLAEGRVEHERTLRRADEEDAAARTASAEAERLVEAGRELDVRRGEAEAHLLALRELAAGKAAALEGLRVEENVLTRDLEAVAARLGEGRLEVQRLELAREDLLRRAEEELALDEAALFTGFEPEPELEDAAALLALEARVRELRAQFERLGPVNLDALSELEEVSSRLGFLEGQVGDLAEARRKLGETLRRIEEESKRLFLETFEEIRAAFQVIFRQLFGGGRADVKLAEGEDVMEAGVEILARPPGREMLPIGLLSGGQRTMTALALLFAVFQCRPSPFCVLDEVDAALDDANVQRFLAMLERFRETTQFVVVTHNKGTMAACQSLYGVTMETKGVSKKVAVQLEEVDAFVPEVAGGSRAARRAGSDLVPETGLADAATLAADDESAYALDAESGERVVEITPPARREEHAEL